MQRAAQVVLEVEGALARLGLVPLREQELLRVVAHALETFLQRRRGAHLVVVGRAPHQAGLAQRPQVAWIDAPLAERLDERQPIAPVVVGHGIGVGSDDGPQELAEGDVHRRAVVERADAHQQHVLRGLGRLLRQPRHQIGMDGARLEQPGAARGQPNQVGGAPLVDAEEGVEDRGDEDGAALVRGPSSSGRRLDRASAVSRRRSPGRRCRWRRAGRLAARAPVRTGRPVDRAGSPGPGATRGSRRSRARGSR